jgi:hypothetical protein
MRALFLLLLLNLAAPAAEPPARTCRILFLSAPDQAPKTLHLFDGVATQEVELTRMGFSPTYQIRQEAVMLALLAAPPPAPTAPGGAPAIPADAPTAKLAAAITDFYLIVTSDPANKVAPVRIQVIDADAVKFKRGQMLWFNLTGSRVGGTVGSRNLVIEPNTRLILDPPATRMEDYHVNIHYLAPGKQRAEPLCETNWSHDPRSRSVFFIFQPAGSVIPRIQGFPDFRETAAKPGAHE